MTSYWFNDVGRALEFAEKHGTLVKGDGTVGWTVEWDGTDTEPPSAFERIVSRNGGEPSLDATYTGGKTIRDSFIDALKEPAEIVQRHRVTGITDSVDGPAPSDEAFSVSLRAMSGPYGVHESRFFAMSKEEAQQFKVGSIIEVVLRPAPLA
jgi:hypothetical protein